MHCKSRRTNEKNGTQTASPRTCEGGGDGLVTTQTAVGDGQQHFARTTPHRHALQKQKKTRSVA